jgi:hypothetical protein
MYRIACLLVVGFIAGASLIAMTRPAAAEANCPQGATCNCVPTTFEKCKVDAQGRQYDCKTYKGEKCTVVSGPGSGKPAAVAQPTGGVVAQPEGGTVTPPGKGNAIKLQKVAPSTAK